MAGLTTADVAKAKLQGELQLWKNKRVPDKLPLANKIRCFLKDVPTATVRVQGWTTNRAREMVVAEDASL